MLSIWIFLHCKIAFVFDNSVTPLPRNFVTPSIIWFYPELLIKTSVKNCENSEKNHQELVKYQVCSEKWWIILLNRVRKNRLQILRILFVCNLWLQCIQIFHILYSTVCCYYCIYLSFDVCITRKLISQSFILHVYVW